MRLISLTGLLVAGALVAGCSSKPIDIPTTPDPGFNGGAAGAGLDDGAITGGTLGGAAGGTLPGSNISDRVLFAVDQSTLSAEAIGTLNAQVTWLTQNPTMPITIEGHADERGTRDYNFQLGSSRASAVRNYLVTQGIPDSRISIITYGRERPVATCPEESCFAQNRRAVTVVTGGAGT